MNQRIREVRLGPEQAQIKVVEVRANRIEEIEIAFLTELNDHLKAVRLWIWILHVARRYRFGRVHPPEQTLFIQSTWGEYSRSVFPKPTKPTVSFFVWYTFFGFLAWLRNVSAISCLAQVLSVESSNTHWQVTWRSTIGQSYQAGIGLERTITDWLQCPRPELAEFRLRQNW